jgi:hypothetical protein
MWQGLPYRSKQVKLANGVINGVYQFDIDRAIDGVVVMFLKKERLVESEMENFAKADGFENVEAMIKFFEDGYGLPFIGQVVAWSKVELSNPATRIK